MAVEVDEIYSNLNKLLNDICKFLADGSNYQKLSPYGRKQADELIGRSKKQLQEIAKLSDDNGAYVDMERKAVKSEEDKKDIYSSVDETITPAVVQNKPNPYLELPAREMSHDTKCGTLFWKYKIILNFEKNRRIYAGIHDDWFLIYSTEKDLKPVQALHLKHYKAQAVVPKQIKNLPQDFELTCTAGECKGKSYYFVATTHKDMLQWTSRMTRCYENLNNQTCVDEDDLSETYDTIPFHSQTDENEENNPPRSSPEKTVVLQKPPDLPARRFIKPKPILPSVPQKQTSSSESSIYDPVEDPKSSSRENSFSEEDEDEEYQEFVSPENNPKLNGGTRKVNLPVNSIVEAKNLKIEKNRHDVVVPRLLKPKIQLPAIPKEDSSSESSIYDEIQDPKKEHDSSFSEPDEDSDYQEFVTPEIKLPSNAKKEREVEEKEETKKGEKRNTALGNSVLERVANLEKPKPLVKPKIIAHKARMFPSLKK